MEDKITNASLSFTCNQNWENMQPTAEGRFCDSCQKKVYDLTDQKTAYFLQIMEENNNSICGRFSANQLTVPAPAINSTWKKWAIAAMVFIGIGAAGQKADAQTLVGKVIPKAVIPDSDPGVMLGEISMVVVDPELMSLHNYMVKNCKVPASTNGRLIASFKVKKDGTLTNFALSEHLSKAVRQEVLNTLKRAPKWNKQKVENNTLHALYLDFVKGSITPN